MLFILGSCFGSFLCCQARRMHLKTTPSKKTKNATLGSRSVCLNCAHQLKWYENIPIISWLILRGKCKNCHRKIGIAEFLSELGVGLAFLAIGTTIDITSGDFLTWAVFVLTLITLLPLSFLAIYDGIYGELPTKYLILSIICAVVLLILKECLIYSTDLFTSALIYNPILSVIILGGLYLSLYKISRGKWVGDGDWILGTAIAIALYDPWLSLITLFVANLLASLVMAPFIRKNKQKKIYFGPFLVIAFVITLTFSDIFYYIIGL